jgi:hypothetical protein
VSYYIKELLNKGDNNPIYLQEQLKYLALIILRQFFWGGKKVSKQLEQDQAHYSFRCLEASELKE